MKINFSKLPCFTDIRKQQKVNVDIKYNFSNALYMQGGGVEVGALAMKIYNSEGEEEYNAQECAIILQFAKKTNTMIADSIEDLMRNNYETEPKEIQNS